MTRPSIRRRSVRARGIVVGLTFALATVLSACGSDSSSDSAAKASPTSSTALVPGTAKIVRFDVPADAPCQGNASQTSFTVKWKTSGAKTTVINIDGAPVPNTSRSSGSTKADVHCDPLPHDVVIIATDSNGHFTTDRKIINTTTTPA